MSILMQLTQSKVSVKTFAAGSTRRFPWPSGSHISAREFLWFPLIVTNICRLTSARKSEESDLGFTGGLCYFGPRRPFHSGPGFRFNVALGRL